MSFIGRKTVYFDDGGEAVEIEGNRRVIHGGFEPLPGMIEITADDGSRVNDLGNGVYEIIDYGGSISVKVARER